jgi:DNA-binding XRE family transcriptional regulator
MGTALRRQGRDRKGDPPHAIRKARRDPARLRHEDAASAASGAETCAEAGEGFRPAPWKELRARLLADPAVQEARKKTSVEFLLMLEISAARARSGLTQAEIARRMGTTQSAVARLETERLPSLRTLKRYAEAVGAKLVVRLEERG